MSNFLAGIFGDVWGTLIMSVVPLIELKGAIIFARGVGLGFFKSLLLAYAGSTVVFVFIFFLLRPILDLLKKIKFVEKFAEKIENYFTEKADTTLKEREDKNKKGLSERALKMLGVFIFVAIPLPMTGVWAGTAIAVFLNLRFKETLLPVAVGNLVAGLIISLLAEICLAVSGSAAILDYILWGLFALALILLVITIVKVSKSKGKSE